MQLSARFEANEPRKGLSWISGPVSTHAGVCVPAPTARCTRGTSHGRRTSSRDCCAVFSRAINARRDTYSPRARQRVTFLSRTLLFINPGVSLIACIASAAQRYQKSSGTRISGSGEETSQGRRRGGGGRRLSEERERSVDEGVAEPS